MVADTTTLAADRVTSRTAAPFLFVTPSPRGDTPPRWAKYDRAPVWDQRRNLAVSVELLNTLALVRIRQSV